MAAQVGDAHGEIDGGRSRQAFGHRRGRQRNGHFEHHHKTVAAQKPDPEHHPADGAAGDDELVAHQCQLQFNRGPGRFGFREHGLQHSDLGEAAGRHHHGQALTARHQRAHVDHVGSVGERSVLVLHAPGVLGHRHALAGQHGFVDTQPVRLDDAAVGGHVGTGFQHQEVSDDHLLHRHVDLTTVADDLCRRMHEILEGLHGFFGAAFGEIADNRIGQDHPADDDRIDQSAGQRRYTGRGTQQVDGQGVQLLKEDFRAGARCRLRQQVGAMLFQALAGSRDGHTVRRVGAQQDCDRLRVECVPGLFDLFFALLGRGEKPLQGLDGQLPRFEWRRHRCRTGRMGTGDIAFCRSGLGLDQDVFQQKGDGVVVVVGVEADQDVAGEGAGLGRKNVPFETEALLEKTFEGIGSEKPFDPEPGATLDFGVNGLNHGYRLSSDESLQAIDGRSALKEADACASAEAHITLLDSQV